MERAVKKIKINLKTVVKTVTKKVLNLVTFSDNVVINCILSLLKLSDLYTFSLLNKHAAKLVHSDGLWGLLLKRDYNFSFQDNICRSDQIRFRRATGQFIKNTETWNNVMYQRHLTLERFLKGSMYRRPYETFNIYGANQSKDVLCKHYNYIGELSVLRFMKKFNFPLDTLMKQNTIVTRILQKGCVPAMRELVKDGFNAQIPYNSKLDYSRPMMIALRNGKIEMIKYLMEIGIRVTPTDIQKNLDSSEEIYTLCLSQLKDEEFTRENILALITGSCRRGNAHGMSFILKRKEMSNLSAVDNRVMLETAIECDASGDMTEELLKYGIKGDINEALLYASDRARFRVIPTLLDYGANINYIDEYKTSALFHSIRTPGYMVLCVDRKKTVEVLLAYGADDSIRDIYKKTVLDYAVELELTMIMELFCGKNVEVNV